MTREEAIELLQLNRGYCEGNDKAMVEALDMAIKALKQEPFINKSCVSEQACEHDKQIVLDKIRAEVESEKIEGFAARNGGLEIAIQVINKYKVESEG